MSQPAGSPSIATGDVSEETRSKKCCSKFLERVVDWLAYKDRSKWLKDMRASLSLTVSIIATITFQSAINPPGGVVQVSDGFNRTTSDSCVADGCPGQAVLAVVSGDQYLAFLICNTISFISSVSVCLLLVSGLYVNNAFLTWLLSIGMCITITSLTLTYLFGAVMVTPDIIGVTADSVFAVVLWVWIGLLTLISSLLIVRFVASGVNKCIKKRNKSATPRRNEEISVNPA